MSWLLEPIDDVGRGTIVFSIIFFKCDVIFAKHRIVPQLAYNRSSQLTDKMSDSDECFDIPRDIKPYNFEPLAK